MSGTVTQTGYKVWVNGKEAAINGQSWLAEDVPLQDAGCALVPARAIPLSDNNGYGTGGSGGTSSTMANPGNPVSAQAKDAEANVDKPDEIVEVLYHKARVDYWVREDGLDETVTEDTFWGRNQTGHSYSDDCYGSSEVRYYTWFDADWNERDEGTSQSGGSPACGVKTASEPQPYGHPEWMEEFCSVQAHRVDADEFHTFQRVRAREAVTAYELHTGGKAAIQRQNLFALTGLAYGISNPFYPEVDSDAQAYAIPYTSVKLGTLGYLGSDSYLYKALPDNKSFDVTPNVPGRRYYRYSQPDKKKYRLWILANDTPCNFDLSPTFCVGEYITFSSGWSPGTPPGILPSSSTKWTLTGNYKNATSGGPMPNQSEFYWANPDLLNTDPAGGIWWVSGGYPWPEPYDVSLEKGLDFSNGQHVDLDEHGLIGISRPHATVQTSTRTIAVDGWLWDAGSQSWFFGMHDGIPPPHGYSGDLIHCLGFSTGCVPGTRVVAAGGSVRGSEIPGERRVRHLVPLGGVCRA